MDSCYLTVSVKIALNVLSNVIPTNMSSEGLKGYVHAATTTQTTTASSGQLAAKINYQPLF